MKKIFLPILAGLLVIGCTRDNINTDSNSAYTTIPSTLIPFAQKQLSDYINTPNVNRNNSRLLMQYWTETIYTQQSNYDYASRSVSDQIYSNNYVSVLNNLVKAKGLINQYDPTLAEAANWPKIKANQLAIIDIMMVYTFQNLVDTFGNIPYSEALKLDETLTPKYDDAATIYADLISRLDTDVNTLTVIPGLSATTSSGSGASGFGAADLYYLGNVTKWKKFGASVMLKAGIALADSNPTLAQTTVNKAIGYGVITAAADNCQLVYLASPNYNPLYTELVASGRTDFVAGSPFMDFLKANNDTRITKFYQPNADGVYLSSPIGAPASQTPGGLDALSLPGTFAMTTTTPGVLLNVTEVNFYLAEAAARWNIGTAATYYNAAITSSFTEWGLPGDAAAYIAAHPYNPANWKKSIGEQAWVAMYNQPLTSWNFYRRLDYPVLTPAIYAVPASDGKVPVRMVYSNREISTNSANVAAAAAAIGGDKMSTKLFWDKF